MEKEIILFHGWGGTGKSLLPLAEELTELGYKTYTPEMPAHGETGQMQMPWDMELFGRWATEQIKQSGFINPILLGHSFGGKILIELAVNQKIKNDIVLINVSGVKPIFSTKQKILKKTSKWAKKLEKMPTYGAARRTIYKYIIREKDYVNASGNLKESFKLIIDKHYDNSISSILNKTLIIWGENDKDTPLWMGEKLNSEIKNSILIKMDGTHGLPLHSPAKVAKMISTHYKQS